MVRPNDWTTYNYTLIDHFQTFPSWLACNKQSKTGQLWDESNTGAYMRQLQVSSKLSVTLPVYKTCTSVLPSVIVCRLTHCMHKISNTVLFCHLLPTTKHNTASRPSVSSFWNRSSVQSGINRRMYSVPVAEKCTHLSILTCYQLISPLSLNISKASQYICFWSRHTLQCWSYAWERRWEGQKGDKDINGNVSQLCGRRVATPALFVFRFCKTNEFTSL